MLRRCNILNASAQRLMNTKAKSYRENTSLMREQLECLLGLRALRGQLISSSPSFSSSVASAIIPKIVTNGFSACLKQWIWSFSSPSSSAVVNVQDLNDFWMVSHEISFHALSIHSTMPFFEGEALLPHSVIHGLFFWFS